MMTLHVLHHRPGQRAENAAGEDREARGEICESGALQQDPHGGVSRMMGCLGYSRMEDVRLFEGPVLEKMAMKTGQPDKNHWLILMFTTNRHWHSAFAGPDTGMMDLFIDDAEGNRFSPRNISPGYFWEYILPCRNRIDNRFNDFATNCFLSACRAKSLMWCLPYRPYNNHPLAKLDLTI